MSIIGPRPGDVESKDTYAQDEKDKLLIKYLNIKGKIGFSDMVYVLKKISEMWL